MKFLITIVLSVLFLSPAFAEIIVRDGKISASFTSQPLHQAVQTISKQSGVEISMDEAIANETVSASFTELPLALGIKKLLEGTGINYAVIAGADGVPSAILISGSEKPGSPPKKLDTRPVTTPTYQNRSVVTPVNPPPPQQRPQNPTPTKDTKQPPQAGANPNQPQAQPTSPRFDPNNVPTGGSFAPSPQIQQPQQPEKTDPNAAADPDEEEDDDEEE